MSTKIWIGFFSLWLLILTGVFTPFTQSPGLIQAFRTRSQLAELQTRLASVEESNEMLEAAIQLLQSNPDEQERQIRSKLGYVHKGDLVLVFHDGN